MLKIHQITPLILGLLIYRVPIWAATSGYQILTYPFSTRVAAMGGTFAADGTQRFQVLTNPASVALSNGIQGQAGTVRHLAGIQGFALGGMLPVEQHRFFGEAAYFNYGTFDKTDVNNNHLGTFGFDELYAGGGYATELFPHFAFGGRTGLYRQQADHKIEQKWISALGGMYHRRNDSLIVGAAIMNFGQKSGVNELPTMIVIGTSTKLQYLPARINIDGQYNLQQQWKLAAGAEFFVNNNLTLRLGLNSNRFDLQTNVLRSDFIAGATAGMGLRVKNFLFELALQSFGGAGIVQQMSAAIRL